MCVRNGSKSYWWLFFILLFISSWADLSVKLKPLSDPKLNRQHMQLQGCKFKPEVALCKSIPRSWRLVYLVDNQLSLFHCQLYSTNHFSSESLQQDWKCTHVVPRVHIKERVSSCLSCHGEPCVKWLCNKFIKQRLYLTNTLSTPTITYQQSFIIIRITVKVKI